MSNVGEPWTLDRERLTEALARWEAHEPSELERNSLNEFLMSLTQDPFGMGHEDDERGIWLGRPNPFTLVVYVIDRDNHQVAVADVNHL